MADFAKEVLDVNLEDEMRQSYLDYAMSVIVGRALPDVRDGLKPVHRRVLFAMSELGNDWNKPYKKSARVVGDVIGKYHPHGDVAVYDTIVRMAQPFSMRYMLVDGQGNFGSIDGDPPAAMRYTEVRLARIAHELLADLDKETVDFVPNYDESEREPTVLPAKLPNLLINGSSGIAVGMATNIPPHNLGEVVSACIALIDDPDVGIDELLLHHLPGPDFPTAALINGAHGIREAYHTGRGRIYLRAKARVEVDEAHHRDVIIVDELPYQVNKARLLERIGELVKEKKLEGIAEMRDESDKDGMRIVIELRRGEMGEVVLNNLYQHTQLQTVFGINMVALVDGQPRTLNLLQLLKYFLRHRREVVTRRILFELRKARERAHLQEGLAIALANIDEVIELIKAAPNPAAAKEGLMGRGWRLGAVTGMLERAGAENARPEDLPPEFGLNADGYRLSEAQAQAILDLRLHRLTGLEQDKILKEFEELLAKIGELLAILSSPDRLMQVIRDELTVLRDQYGDARRTEIVLTQQDLSREDLITPEDLVVTLSHAGYAKAQPVTQYQAQRRGGKGKTATSTKDEDFVDKLFIANTHDTILCFSSRGKVYWLKVYELPQAGRNARGRPMVNLLPLEQGERINAVLPVHEYLSGSFVFMATSSGTVKKTPLEDFSRPLARGIIAVDLREDDQLVGVALTDGEREVMLFTSNGKAIRFQESEVRAMGRTACGVRGMRLAQGERIISLIIAGPGTILMATANGYGKRTALDQFSVQGRGGQGVICIRTNERNGQQVGAVLVQEEDEIMLITNGGTLVRTRVADVPVTGRATQGVKLISLSGEERLVGLDRIEPMEEDGELDTGEITET
jgi:DNA gyrase subunit A